MRRDLEQGTSPAKGYHPSSDASPTAATDGRVAAPMHAASIHAAPRQPSLARAMRPREPVRTMTLDEELFLDMQRGCRG